MGIFDGEKKVACFECWEAEMEAAQKKTKGKNKVQIQKMMSHLPNRVSDSHQV